MVSWNVLPSNRSTNSMLLCFLALIYVPLIYLIGFLELNLWGNTGLDVKWDYIQQKYEVWVRENLLHKSEVVQQDEDVIWWFRRQAFLS